MVSYSPDPGGGVDREFAGVVVLVEPHASGGRGGAEVVEVLRGPLVAVGGLTVHLAGAARGADVGQAQVLRVVEHLVDVGQELRVPDVGADAVEPGLVEPLPDLRRRDVNALRPVAGELDLLVADAREFLEYRQEAEGCDLVAHGEQLDAEVAAGNEPLAGGRDGRLRPHRAQRQRGGRAGGCADESPAAETVFLAHRPSSSAQPGGR